MTEIEREADLVCEALVREIGRAQRWQAVKEAHDALLTVRRISNQMAVEQRHLAGAQQQGAEYSKAPLLDYGIQGL